MDGTKLLIRLAPKSHETFFSYVYRLCRVNGLTFEAFSFLVKREVGLQLMSSKLEDRQSIKVTISKIVNGKFNLKVFNERDFKQEFPELFEYQKIKICPVCFEEEQVINFKWPFKHYLVCETHNVLLVDRCGACNKLFDKKALINHKCSYCKNVLCPVPPKTAQVDSLTSFIGCFKPSVEHSELSTLQRNVRKLYPYGMLLFSDSYRNWLNSKNTRVDKLHEIQIRLISFYNDKSRVYQEIYRYIETTPGNIAEKFEEYYYSNLRGSHYIEFKADLLTVLFMHSDSFTEFKVTLNWLEKIFDIPAEEGRQKLLESDSVDLDNRGGFSVKYLPILSSLAYKIKSSH